MEANIGVMTGRIKNVVYPNRKVYRMEACEKELRRDLAGTVSALEAEREKVEQLVKASKDCLVWVEAMARGGRPQAFAALDAMLSAIRKAENVQ